MSVKRKTIGDLDWASRFTFPARRKSSCTRKYFSTRLQPRWSSIWPRLLRGYRLLPPSFLIADESIDWIEPGDRCGKRYAVGKSLKPLCPATSGYWNSTGKLRTLLRLSLSQSASRMLGPLPFGLSNRRIRFWIDRANPEQPGDTRTHLHSASN